MLIGSLVTLRTLHADDLPTLYTLAAELETWEMRRTDPPAPLPYEAFLADHALTDTTRCEFAIEADGVVVGRCGLMHIDPLARHAEVGIGLVSEARGRGYGTDALRVLIDFAFTRRNLRRLHLAALGSNEAALASYRKAGFVEEGRRREHCWDRGRYTDEVVMGILRP